MALLDGLNVFGIGVICPPPSINPRRDQKANYPGLNGTESLDMGDQGAFTTVTGRLYGTDPGSYQAAVSALMAFFDGNVHVLTDNDGFSWPNVKFESIEWGNERGQRDADLGFTRRYTARFFHLTLT